MITSKHGRKHEARPPGQVKKRKEKKSSVSRFKRFGYICAGASNVGAIKFVTDKPSQPI